MCSARIKIDQALISSSKRYNNTLSLLLIESVKRAPAFEVTTTGSDFIEWLDFLKSNSFRFCDVSRSSYLASFFDPMNFPGLRPFA